MLEELKGKEEDVEGTITSGHGRVGLYPDYGL